MTRAPSAPQGRGLLAGLGFAAVTFGVAAFAARFQPGVWYESLARPAWTPPDWLFAPVWTVLYAAIALAGWLLWRERSRPEARAALVAWAVQLGLNALWSALFFGLHRPGLAFAEILLLLGAIVITIQRAARVRAAAAWLLAPYLVWVAFAAALNGAIWRLNG